MSWKRQIISAWLRNNLGLQSADWSTNNQAFFCYLFNIHTNYSESFTCTTEKDRGSKMASYKPLKGSLPSTGDRAQWHRTVIIVMSIVTLYLPMNLKVCNVQSHLGNHNLKIFYSVTLDLGSLLRGQIWSLNIKVSLYHLLLRLEIPDVQPKYRKL